MRGNLRKELGRERLHDDGFCEFFDWEAAPTGAGASEDANGNTYVRPNGFK